jgi:hypothetical protein
MSDPQMEVDLSAKKTETGWQVAWDYFWLAFTPKLFEWLGWIALLSAVRFVQAASPNAWLGFLDALCSVAMFSYFMAFFYRFKFVGIRWLRKERAHRFASVVVSGALATFAYYAAFIAVEALSNVRP